MTALVSVVVPAYNAEATLARTLQSIIDQTVGVAEIIVVDDGSTDGTAELTRQYAEADARVRLLSKSNGGASSARNAGIASATGEFIGFLDADDVWLPHKLERQLEVFERHTEVGAVQAGAVHVDGDLRPLFRLACVPGRMHPMEVLRFRNLPAFPTTLMLRREAVATIGVFDTSLAILEDWEFALRASVRSVLWSIEEPLALYCVHPGNRSLDLDLHVAPGMLVLARLFDGPDLPPELHGKKNEAYARMFLMLAGGAFRVRRWGSLIRWGARAIASDFRTVAYMAALPLRRLRRRRSRGRGRSVGGGAV